MTPGKRRDLVTFTIALVSLHLYGRTRAELADVRRQLDGKARADGTADAVVDTVLDAVPGPWGVAVRALRRVTK